MEYAQQLFGQFFGTDWGVMLFSLTKNLALIFAIVIPLLLGVAYLTFAERKIIASMQIRVGPNRVTFFGIPWLGGWGQPIADAVKAMMKEIIVPNGANKVLFICWGQRKQYNGCRYEQNDFHFTKQTKQQGY